MQVYDPIRQTVMSDRETEILGDCDGWFPARYAEGGDWFALHFATNQSRRIEEVEDAAVRRALSTCVEHCVDREDLLERCVLCDGTLPLEESVSMNGRGNSMQLAVEAARREGHSDALIGSALRSKDEGVSLEQLRTDVLHRMGEES